jgi:hypothetical protein
MEVLDIIFPARESIAFSLELQVEVCPAPLTAEESMLGSRRSLLFTSLAALGAVCLRPKSLSAQNHLPPPPLHHDDEKPLGSPDSSAPSTKTLLEQNQKSIKKDIEKLYQLVTQLKTEVEKTDSTAVLSLALVKKAEEIEKLAKQIKERAKG